MNQHQIITEKTKNLEAFFGLIRTLQEEEEKPSPPFMCSIPPMTKTQVISLLAPMLKLVVDQQEEITLLKYKVEEMGGQVNQLQRRQPPTRYGASPK